ncbi:hypothetical protein [Paraburkholderia sp. GAS448]|uniref:hypothetical protein n=1 Tax=Paraburkholderia sp. GAS448 TaxID=3035136 RepID=UPI003D1AAD29
MLLPLPATEVRALSLENHLALAAMRSGHGTISLAMHLLRVLYLAWFLRDATEGERYSEHLQIGSVRVDVDSSLSTT